MIGYLGFATKYFSGREREWRKSRCVKMKLDRL